MTGRLDSRTDAGARAEEESTATGLVRGVRWLTVSTLVLSLLNYVYSLGLTHLLDVGAFAVFAAGQALLLTAGTVSNAAVPWVLAQTLSTATGAEDRRRAVWFGLTLNTGLGVLGGALLYGLGLGFAGPRTSLVLAVATFLVFVASSTVGVLQGARRFGLLGVLKVGDSALKIAVGLALVAVGTGAAGALGGFAAGSLLLIAAGGWVARRDLRRPVRGTLRAPHLWRTTAGVGAVQALLSLLVTLDVVLVAYLLPDEAAATYQASMILSRVPLFLAGAVAATVFPLLSRDPDGLEDVVRRAVRSFLLMVVPYAVALACVPAPLLALVFPPEYSRMSVVLPLTAVAGAAIGAVNLVTTVFQARRRYVRSVVAQVAGLAVHAGALTVGAALDGLVGMAVGAVVGTTASLVALLVAAPARWRRALVPTPDVLALGAAVVPVFVLLQPWPWAWVPVVGTTGLAAAVVALRGRPPRVRTGRAAT
ncbi:lipopolysaccharide biosynthesis protein [Aquipuribacter sp. SD81]|uniref:lipopolysaccharide biosynthesis protein n=1 Tax=Aquipuribacter sp. SD81 TaxID=3127703 RepID=UPI003017BFAE